MDESHILVGPEDKPKKSPVRKTASKFKSSLPQYHLILAASAVIFIVSVIIGFTYKSRQSYQQQQAEYKKPAPTPTTAASVNDTSNWKTYRNEKYGFSFDYPENWNIDVDGHSYQRFQIINNEEAQFPGYYGSAGIFFTVEKTPNDSENIGYIFESMYSSSSKCPEVAGEIDLRDTVNVYCLTGQQIQTEVGRWKEAVECSAYDLYGLGKGPENCPHQFWLDTNDYFYYFHFNIFEPIEKGSEADITFIQILSTFEFLDNTTKTVSPKDTFQTTETNSSWNTYTNKEYGFKISYPKDWIADDNGIHAHSEDEDHSFVVGLNLWGDSGMPHCRIEGEEINISGINTGKWFKPSCQRSKSFPILSEDECYKHSCKYVVESHLCLDSNHNPDANHEGCLNSRDGYAYYQFHLSCSEYKIGREAKEHCSELFNQILSTFKFLD